MKLSNWAGLATYGLRTLAYLVLIILTSVAKYYFTEVTILCIAIAMAIYVIVICFPETMARSVKYKAVFETVLTMVVFLGNRFGLKVDFLLGLILLLGWNLTMMLCVISDNKQK